jgi:hypothetical protein
MVIEELVRVIVWPVGLKKLKISTRVTVLLTAESLVSEMVPMTLVPVGAVAGATDAATVRSTSTVTVKVADTVDGLSSELPAVHVTVVVPTANVEPETGEHTTAVAELSPTSSTAVGAV